MDANKRLLAAVKAACGLRSDNALAEKLHVTRALISGWRNGLYPIPDERIAEICKMAKLDAAAWLSEIRLEEAKSPEARAMWQGAYKRLSAAALLALCAIGFAGNALPAKASASAAHCLHIM